MQTCCEVRGRLSSASHRPGGAITPTFPSPLIPSSCGNRKWCYWSCFLLALSNSVFGEVGLSKRRITSSSYPNTFKPQNDTAVRPLHHPTIMADGCESHIKVLSNTKLQSLTQDPSPRTTPRKLRLRSVAKAKINDKLRETRQKGSIRILQYFCRIVKKKSRSELDRDYF
jgi:hypothetical protein